MACPTTLSPSVLVSAELMRPPPAAPVSRANRKGPLPSIRTSRRTSGPAIIGTSVEAEAISERVNGRGGGPWRRTWASAAGTRARQPARQPASKAETKRGLCMGLSSWGSSLHNAARQEEFPGRRKMKMQSEAGAAEVAGRHGPVFGAVAVGRDRVVVGRGRRAHVPRPGHDPAGGDLLIDHDRSGADPRVVDVVGRAVRVEPLVTRVRGRVRGVGPMGAVGGVVHADLVFVDSPNAGDSLARRESGAGSLEDD